MMKLKQTLSKKGVQSGLITATIILILVLVGPVGAYPGQYNPQQYGYPPGPGGGGVSRDRTAPEFIRVWVTDITHNSANVHVEVNEKVDCQVEYWSSPSLLTPLHTTLVTTHRMHLANLTPETTYNFNVIVRDKAQNKSVSDEHSFTTLATPLAPDTTSPVISNVSATDITTDSANIKWTTDEKSDNQVEYWASPHTVTPLDSALVTSHEVHLSNLTPATTYHYKVKSSDAAGNLAVSGEYTFTTLAPPTPPVSPTPPVPPAPPKLANWWLIGGIIGGVVVVGLLAYFLWWRRRVV